MRRRRSVLSAVVAVLGLGAGGFAIALTTGGSASGQNACPTQTVVEPSIESAELLAEQRDTNLAGPKIIDVPCGADLGRDPRTPPSYEYRAAAPVPMVSITVVNRGDCPVQTAGLGVPLKRVAPGAARTEVADFHQFQVFCLEGTGRCRFEVTVTKV
jgi:hypothetical protein